MTADHDENATIAGLGFLLFYLDPSNDFLDLRLSGNINLDLVGSLGP